MYVNAEAPDRGDADMSAETRFSLPPFYLIVRRFERHEDLSTFLLCWRLHYLLTRRKPLSP